jgi:hypothetical protein
VETTLPDGGKRITRPGVCGWTLVAPNGQKQTMSCAQVQVDTPPLPDGPMAQWLDGHSTRLLDIARMLLGNDQTSIDNYLRSTENAQQSVYDRIRLRTDLLTKLAP